jgi:hypothetical protein
MNRDEGRTDATRTSDARANAPDRDDRERAAESDQGIPRARDLVSGRAQVDDGVAAAIDVVAAARLYDEGNEDGSNRDVPPFDNDPRSDEQLKQAVYDRADDFLDGFDV